MVSNTGSIEHVNTNTFLNTPSTTGNKAPSLGRTLFKLAFLAGLDRLTFGKLSCIRNSIDKTSNKLAQALAHTSYDILASMLPSKESLISIQDTVSQKLGGLQCKANPEGLKERAINFAKDISGVNQAAQLANNMIQTMVTLFTEAKSDMPNPTLKRLLFATGILYHNNTDVKQVFDGIKSAALDKVFSKEFITDFLKSCNLGIFSKLVNRTVARLGIQSIADKSITDYLFANPKIDMTRMELYDAHEILIAEGMQKFCDLDGDNWDKDEVNEVFNTLVKNDENAKKLAEQFDSIKELYEGSKLAQTATNVVGFIFHDIVKPIALNVSSNVAQMTPKQFCELYQHPDQINKSKIVGLLLGNNLDMAGRIEQKIDSVLQTANQISETVHTVSEKVQTVVEVGKKVITKTLEKAKDIGQAAMNAVAEQASNIKQVVKEKVPQIGQAIAKTASKVAQAAVGDIDISGALDDLDEEFKPLSPKNISTPAERTTVSEIDSSISAKELRLKFHLWDRSHTIEMQNQLNAAEIHDDNPIQDKGYTWTATYPLSHSTRSAIENQRVNMYLEGKSMILDEKDRARSLVTQLHDYVADHNSQNDATHVITQFSKLLDGENLKSFLPETLREQINDDPHVFVDVKSKHPLTFETHVSWQVEGHEVEVHFTANIKETVKKGWTGSTITGNFVSTSTMDPSQDSLQNVRYFLDNEPILQNIRHFTDNKAILI